MQVFDRMAKKGAIVFDHAHGHTVSEASGYVSVRKGLLAVV